MVQLVSFIIFNLFLTGIHSYSTYIRSISLTRQFYPRKVNIQENEVSRNGAKTLTRQLATTIESDTHQAYASHLKDKLDAIKFHHIEFYCGDAVTTYKRFQLGLGAKLVAKSDQSTGNNIYASYVLQTGDVRMVFTAPYGDANNQASISTDSHNIVSKYNQTFARNFIIKHGLAVRAICIEVRDVTKAYDNMISNGAVSVYEPSQISNTETGEMFQIAEISIYGDVVLRLISTNAKKNGFLPHYSAMPCNDISEIPYFLSNDNTQSTSNDAGLYGIRKFDHIVGNLWSLQPTTDLLKNITGFHEFAEFVAEDVGTVDSGLNSVVLASSNEMVLLPLNEPTFGTKRKSQIQTYLEQNQGEGVQHIALKTDDIFHTLSCMKKMSLWGGFEFMDPPSKEYYANVRKRLGNHLSENDYQQIEKYGILADRDTEGTLLQIFTKPIGDRATIFLEIIQRVGCQISEKEQKPGCGGFGKGNFRDLFKSIEDYEKKLNI